MINEEFNEKLILTLLNIPKVGVKMVNSILEIGIKKSLDTDVIIDIFCKCRTYNKRIPIPSKEDIEMAKKTACEIIENSKKQGIGIISILDEDFPKKLKIIKDNPVILFYKGDKTCLYENKTVAIIGTRNPTPHGAKIAERLGYLFGSDKFVVVSGLAKGCDEFAHQGCVDTNGRSIAVLPCGLDTIYPQNNKKLAEDILKAGGCIVSEYAIGQKPFKHLFVERDRIQSALSLGVIVIETAEKGGTMHTVGFAIEQNKMLACYEHKENLKHEKQVQGNLLLLEKKNAIGLHNQDTIDIFKKLVIEKANELLDFNENINCVEQMDFEI